MIQFTNTIHIQQPVDVVYALCSDLKNLPLWNYYIMEVLLEKDGTYLVKRKKDMFRVVQTEQVTNETFGYETIQNRKLSVKRSMKFSADAKGIMITDTIQLSTSFPTILERIIKKRIQKAVGENLQKLKTLLETGQCLLQNGRYSYLKEYSQDL